MPHTPPDCVCVCMGDYGCVCTSLCACFLSCVCSQVQECVVCHSLCCLLCPLHSNAAETLMHQTQLQAAWVQGGQKKMAVSKETSLPVIYVLYVQTLLVQDQILHVFHFVSFDFCIHVCDALRIIIRIHGCSWSCHFLFMSIYIIYVVCICIRTTVMKPFKACVHGWIIN